jgi:peptidoglycan-associated lipoprotein
MVRMSPRIGYGFVCVVIMVLGGCTDMVKRSDFDAAITELRNNDQRQQQEIDAITQEMHQRFAKYDAQIAEMQGRVRVDSIAMFDTDKADLRDQDKHLLDDYAKVLREHHTNALITAEGFTDPSGSAGHNYRLGMRRAEAVRNYLVQTGGLPASQVRAVSYGQAKNRQVIPGASGDKGLPNRRVSLVVDFAGGESNAADAGSSNS